MAKRKKSRAPPSRPSGGRHNARPIWNGSISFGLLNIPVQLFSAERSFDLHFRMLDSRNNSPVRYERVNSETGEEVPWSEIVKAFEYAKGSYVVIDEEDIREAAPEATETVAIESFVDGESIDPRYFEKPYYLIPSPKAEKGYVLLREILRRKKKIGIAKVVIRTRQYLAALMPLKDALVLDLMRFEQEIVPTAEFAFPEGPAASYRLTARELEMGEQLIESMTTDWNPADYTDDFRAKLRKIIDARVAKAEGKTVRIEKPIESARQDASNVVDFTALLKRSLAGKPNGAEKRARPRRKKAG
jgi:DNA end-binding protein Ku